MVGFITAGVGRRSKDTAQIRELQITNAPANGSLSHIPRPRDQAPWHHRPQQSSNLARKPPPLWQGLPLAGGRSEANRSRLGVSAVARVAKRVWIATSNEKPDLQVGDRDGSGLAACCRSSLGS